MTRLFVNLYLDEDVSALIATLVRARDLNAVTTRQAGQCGNADEQQLLFAAERGMCVFTHNRNDYLQLAADFSQNKRPHSGIIIAVRRPPYLITGKLLQLLNEVSAEEMDNQVYFI